MSIKIDVYNQNAETVGKVELSERVFGVKLSEPLVHQAMVAQMANERQVIAHTKDRSEVRGGGKKPWRQKGTGRARAGSNRSPIWIGGGVTFGPSKDRNFSKKINKKMKQRAIMMVLTDKAESKNIKVLDELQAGEFKTKDMALMLSKFAGEQKKPAAPKKEIKNTKKSQEKIQKTKKQKRSVLIINENKDDKLKFSFRNLAGVEFINLDNINILDLLKYKDIFTTKEAIKKIEEKYKGK